MPEYGKAIQITAPEKFEIIDLPIPTPADDEVLIEIKACATCTNWEINTWRGIDIFSRPGYPIYPQNPGSPGHEAAGIVIGLGKDVTKFKVGDHIAVLGSGRGDENDAHATHIVRDNTQVALLDPKISFVDAAPLEMALCALRMVDVMGDIRGKSVAIIGLGPAGLFHLQIARAKGAAKIYGFDTIPARLEAAAPYADVIVDSSNDEQRIAIIAEGAQYVVDCSGHPVGMRTGLDMAREKFFVFAVPHGPVEWGKMDWLRGMPILPYNWAGGTQIDCLQRSADMLAAGEIDTKGIISTVLPYTQYDKGQEMLINRTAIKIVFSGWE